MAGVDVIQRDVLGEADADVIVPAVLVTQDSPRDLPWLVAARMAGLDVIVGDPGRRYLPTPELIELAVYDVRTTTELEDLELKQGRVFGLRAPGHEVSRDR
jgi:predicted nicotinamide N-methyase